MASSSGWPDGSGVGSEVSRESLQSALIRTRRHFLWASQAHTARSGQLLDAGPLRDLVSRLGAAGRGSVDGLGDHVTPPRYAEVLARAESVWAAEERGVAVTRLFPRGMSWDAWLEAGGANPKYRAVWRLRRLAAAGTRRLFVHGSVAALDDLPGFSDLDVAVILPTEALVVPEQLLDLRERLLHVWIEMLSFDPFMHHGPHLIAESDLGFYPESFLPAAVLDRSVGLGERPELAYSGHPAEGEAAAGLADLRGFFEARSGGHRFADQYDAEWFVGNILILPALLAQRSTGEFRFKKDSFALLPGLAPPGFASLIEDASRARRAMRTRFRVGSHLRLAARVLRFPGLIDRFARKSRRSKANAARAAQALPDDASARAVAFIDFISGLRPGGSGTGLYWLLPNHNQRSDEPLPTAPVDYDAASAEIEAIWSASLSPPIAVFQIGGIGAPGISDLDFVLVYRRPDPSIARELYPVERLSSLARRLVTHAPYACLEEHLVHLPAWYPAWEARRRSGLDLQVARPGPAIDSGLAAAHLVDYLIAKIPADLLQCAWRTPLPVRQLLALLYSLTHTLRLAQRAGLVPPPSLPAAVEQVQRLRHSWFDGGGGDHGLRTAWLACVEGALDLIEVVDAAIAVRGGAAPVTPLPQTVFHSHWDRRDALRRAFTGFGVTGAVEWSVPASFQSVLASYASASPLWRSHLGDGLPPPLPADHPWSPGIARHADVSASVARFRRASSIPEEKYVALGIGRARERILPRRWLPFFWMLRSGDSR